MTFQLPHRPRRNRVSAGIRDLVRENHVSVKDLIWPCFIVKGKKQRIEIDSMPGCFRFSIDELLKEAREACQLGIPAIALFPALDDERKDKYASESKNENGLLQRAIRELKKECPELVLIGDVAMDPYSSDGHDGLVDKGEILNDETLPILAEMALNQARAGVDIVAPSDMMDGRVAAIRDHLDEHGFHKVGILSYSAKYCSAFYGPFRDALDSAPKSGDKKTYQMDPANSKEAMREVVLDIEEGADMVMVKPGMPYLDIVSKVKEGIELPVAVYHVSGEYSMIKAGSIQGWIDEKSVVMESLLAFKRAGADMILTYFAKDAAKWLSE
jgi:porphobilinogen synthase